MNTIRVLLVTARATVAGLVLMLPAHATAQTLFFSAFDQDDTGYFDLEFGAPDVQVLFDTTLGSPNPGSLRLSRTTTPLPAQLVSPCLEISENRRLTMIADARSDSVGAGCTLAFFLHDDPACMDGPSVLPDPPQGAQSTDTWETVQASFAGSEQATPPLAMRFTLNLLTSVAPAACNFDNIRIFSEQVESIPATGGWGRWLLLAGLAVTALWLLRRTR